MVFIKIQSAARAAVVQDIAIYASGFPRRVGGQLLRVLRPGGVLLRAAGRPVGFSIFSPLPEGVWDIHFEKADHEVKGAPQMLVVKVAEALLARGGRLMNREQDMGEPGLRRAKHSLDPGAMYRRVFLKVKA